MMAFQKQSHAHLFTDHLDSRLIYEIYNKKQKQKSKKNKTNTKKQQQTNPLIY